MNDPRFDYEQQQDEQKREAMTLQALMDIAACGLREQADFLASECGLSRQWQATINTAQRRQA